MFELRDYQTRCVDLTMGTLDQYPSSAPIIDAACGAGKSLIISALADRIIQASPGGGRVLVVTHRAELVRQDHDKLPKHLRGSIFSASVGKKDVSGDVIFANIQSLVKQWNVLPKLCAVLIDECHVASKMYAEFLDNVRKVSPNIRVVGFTATPFNGAGIHLHMVKDHRIFSGVSARVGIAELLKLGFLSYVSPYAAPTRLSTDNVAFDTRAGDFNAKQLQAAVDVPELVAKCAVEIKEIFVDRSSVLVFCSGIEHAHHVAKALGAGAKVVTGATGKVERAQLLKDFSAGRIKYLCSVDLITTGFDAPITSGIANLRPSRSPLVWLQLIGRGMRLYPDKVDCLVADWTDNTDFFGPIDEIAGRPPSNSLGDAPVRICDGCFNLILACLKVCPHCGYQYEHTAHEKRLDPETGLLLSLTETDEDGIKWFPVSDVTYRIQGTRAGSEAIVAEYMSPGRKARVAESYYLLFDHRASVVRKAQAEWMRRAIIPGLPTNAQDALARAELGGLKVPRMVGVKPGSPFPVGFRL